MKVVECELKDPPGWSVFRSRPAKARMRRAVSRIRELARFDRQSCCEPCATRIEKECGAELEDNLDAQLGVSGMCSTGWMPKSSSTA